MFCAFHSLHSFGEVLHRLVLLCEWAVENVSELFCFLTWIQCPHNQSIHVLILVDEEGPLGLASAANIRYMLKHLSLQAQGH